MGLRRTAISLLLVVTLLASPLFLLIGPSTAYAATNGCGMVINGFSVLSSNIGPCTGPGIIIGSDNVALDCRGHTITGTGTSAGVNVRSRSGVTIKNCVTNDFEFGFNVTTSSHLARLVNDTAVNDGYGFHVYRSSGTQLVGDAANDNGFGFEIIASTGTVLSGNTANNNNGVLPSLAGARVASGPDSVTRLRVGDGSDAPQPEFDFGGNSGTSSGNQLIRNVANGNGIGFEIISATPSATSIPNPGIGFYFFGSTTSMAENNVAMGNGYGYYITNDSDYNQFSGNTARENNFGFDLVFSLGDSLVGNTANGNTAPGGTGIGIYLQASSNNLLLGNTIENNNDGAIVASPSTHDNLLLNDTANGDTEYGFYAFQSDNNRLQGNTADGDTYGYQIGSSASTLISSSVANNNVIGFNIGGSSFGSLLIGDAATGNSQVGFNVGSDRVTLTGNTARNNDFGFYVSNSKYVELSRNFATGNANAFNIVSDSNISARDNVANGNSGNGFYVYGSDLADLSGNTASANQFGLFVTGSTSDSLFEYNRLDNNQFGLELISSPSNAVNDNVASGNTGIGFYVYGSSGVTLGANDATGNAYGFVMDATATSNTLDFDRADSNSGVGFLDYSAGSLTAGTANTYASDECSGNGVQGSVPSGLCSPPQPSFGSGSVMPGDLGLGIPLGLGNVDWLLASPWAS